MIESPKVDQESIEKQQKIVRLKELGIENFNNNPEFFRDVIAKGKEFSTRVEGVGTMYDGKKFGEDFALKLEELLKELNFKDFGFVLRCASRSYGPYFDEDNIEKGEHPKESEVLFEVTPLRDFDNIKMFQTASNLIMKEKLFKFKRNTKRGSESKYTIELPGGNSFLIDENNPEEVQKKVIEEIKRIYREILM